MKISSEFLQHNYQLLDKTKRVPFAFKPDQNPDQGDLFINKTKCSICYNQLSDVDLSVSILDYCQHTFCQSCYKQYLETKMQAFEVINITCPQEGCKEILTENQIKKILDENRYKKYRELVLKKLTYRNLNQRIFCPKAGCGRQISIKNKTLLMCACGTSICQKCFSPLHPGKSCLDLLDPEFLVYTQENDIKFCLMCKTPMARVEGCKHITCCVCDYEWCWICGKEYDHPHQCLGVWNPSSPEIYKGWPDKKKIIESFRFCMFSLLLIPFGLLVFALCWPLFISDGLAKRLTLNKPLKCFGSFLLIGVFGLLTSPISFTFGVIYLLFLLLKKMKEFKFQIQKNYDNLSKRWRKGNTDNFIYTQIGRPTQDELPSINQPERKKEGGKKIRRRNSAPNLKSILVHNS